MKLFGFGSFEVRQKGKRIGRNPKTGVEAPISPRRVMMFRASALLKQRVAHGDKCDRQSDENPAEDRLVRSRG